MDPMQNIQRLVKALEAGSYNAAPGMLRQGAALQIEDLSPEMENVCYTDQHIKLQRMVSVKKCKSTLAQFDRQLSYGQFGGSAQFEGAIGQEQTSDFVRVTVPMCYYAHMRNTSLVADMVDTVDGQKASERQASDATILIAGDVEFDLFRGKADYTNGGNFDGHPSAIPVLPNMLGLDAQIRQSDSQLNTRDLMFSEYGSDETVVIAGGGILQQGMIEDAHVRSAMNMGSADKLVVDPKVLSAYNKIAYGKERIILAGSPQDATGADLRRQWTSGGTVNIESSRFLSGKTGPASPRNNGPSAPANVTWASVGGSGTTFGAGEVYKYFVCTGNEAGESPRFNPITATVANAGDLIRLTITQPAAGVARFYNVYRTDAGGSKFRFIGRVARDTSGTTTTFDDLNNKKPGFVTGFLLQGDTMEVKELKEYSRLKMGLSQLATPEAHFRFLCLTVKQPRKNALIDNLVGSF